MNDRFVRGVISGIAGSVVISIMDYLFMFMGYKQRVHADWAGILIYGHPSTSTAEMLVSQIGHIMFNTLTAVIFAFLIIYIGKEYLIFKGSVYGLFIWFGTYTVAELAKIPQLSSFTTPEALTDIIVAAAFGISIAFILQVLGEKRMHKT